MKLKRLVFVLLILSFYNLKSYAQTKESLNYYSEETLSAIDASAEQKEKIREIRVNTATKIREITDDRNLSLPEKQVKFKEIYATGGALYNEVVTPNQNAVLKKLLRDIQARNIKNGFPLLIDSNYKNKYYDQRMELFASQPIAKNSVVFLGNSITERGIWQELFPSKTIANRGIGGDNTFGVLSRLDEIIAAKPEKIFLMIGVNDLASRGWPVALVLKNYARIVDKITKGSPKTKLFVQSVLPINEEMISIERFKGRSIFIKEFNEKLIVLSASKKLIYVDLFNQFIDDTGKLKKEFTNDGIHLTPLAYTAWVKYLKDNKYL